MVLQAQMPMAPVPMVAKVALQAATRVMRTRQHVQNAQPVRSTISKARHRLQLARIVGLARSTRVQEGQHHVLEHGLVVQMENTFRVRTPLHLESVHLVLSPDFTGTMVLREASTTRHSNVSHGATSAPLGMSASAQMPLILQTVLLAKPAFSVQQTPIATAHAHHVQLDTRQSLEQVSAMLIA